MAIWSVAVMAVVVMVVAADAQGTNFGATIGGTRCNTDPSRGELTNPCASLYNGVCGGAYCSCPRGQVEDPTLHTCVPGDDHGNGGGQGDLFDDLPFDYVPPGQAPTGRPLSPAAGVDVGDTRCSRNNDPCMSLYGAVCDVTGHCVCPEDTRHHATIARCDPVSSTGRRGGASGGGGFRVVHDDHDDHDHHDHDHDHDHDDDDHIISWSFGNAAPALPNGLLSLPVALFTAGVFSWML